MAKTENIFGELGGGGGIDLLNPDSYSGLAAQFSISANGTATVTLSDTPKYGIINMSFNGSAETTYFYLIDFTNQTAKFAGFEGNWYTLADATFSTIIPAFSGTSVTVKNQSGDRGAYVTFLAYY